MPKIPTYTAEGHAAVPNFPQIPLFRGTGAQMVAQGLGAISDASGQMATVAREIKQQKDETELIRQQYSYDPDIETLKRDVLANPDVENPVVEFTDRATTLQQSYLDKIQDPGVKQAFQRHIDKTFPKIQTEMTFDALKLQNEKNVAGLHEIQDTLSTTAATGTPEVRDQAIADFNAQVNSAERRGTINAIKAVDMKRAFRVSLMTKNMTALALDDPYKLFELQKKGAYADVDAVVQQRVLQQARTQIESDQTKIDARFKVAQKANEDYYFTEALNGRIGDSELQMMADGHHPYVTDPHKIKTLIAWNSDPVSIADSKPVEAIMLDFKAMSMKSPEKVVEATERARAQLDAYRSTLTKRDPSLVKAYGALQAAELIIARETRAQEGVVRAVESSQRAERNEVRSIERQGVSDERYNTSQERIARNEAQAKIHRDTQTALEMYKATAPKLSMVPQIASRQKAEQYREQNQLRLLVEGGLAPKEALDTITKARKDKRPPASTGSQDDPVLQLVPKR